MPTARNYRREWLTYDGKPKRKSERAARMRARRLMVKEGRVRSGDGREVDHKDLNPLNNKRSNLQVISAKANRSKQPKKKNGSKHGLRKGGVVKKKGKK